MINSSSSAADDLKFLTQLQRRLPARPRNLETGRVPGSEGDAYRAGLDAVLKKYGSYAAFQVAAQLPDPEGLKRGDGTSTLSSAPQDDGELADILVTAARRQETLPPPPAPEPAPFEDDPVFPVTARRRLEQLPTVAQAQEVQPFEDDPVFPVTARRQQETLPVSLSTRLAQQDTGPAPFEDNPEFPVTAIRRVEALAGAPPQGQVPSPQPQPAPAAPAQRVYSDEEVFGAAAPTPTAADGPRVYSDEEVFGTPQPVRTGEKRPSLWARYVANTRDMFNTNTLAGAASNAPGSLMMATGSDAFAPASIVEQRLTMAKAANEAAAQAERQRAAEYKAMPDSETLPEYAAALAGQITGSLPTPETFLTFGLAPLASRGLMRAAPTIGKALGPLGRRFVGAGADQAVVQAVTDPLVQGARMGTGVQDDYNVLQTVLSPVLGFGLGGTLGVAPRVARAVSEEVRSIFARKNNLKPEETPPLDQISGEEMIADPDIRAVLEANGIVDIKDPRYTMAVEKIMARRAREADPVARVMAAAGRPIAENEAPVPRTRESLNADKEIDADRRAAQLVQSVRDKNFDPQRVTAEAVQSAEARLDARRPGEAAPEQIVVSQRGQAGEAGDVQASVSDRAQTDRQAGEAFRLADRERGRIAAAEEPILDAKAGGRPQGVDPEKVILHEDRPVRIVDIRTEQRKVGEGDDAATVEIEVATVRRYDPRTGKDEPDSVPYDVSPRSLTSRRYVKNPVLAEDFQRRAKGPVPPERPRMADEPVRREPNQTFRQTAPDNNEQFPGATGARTEPGPDAPKGDPTGRSPLPEQPDGPFPGPQRAKTEDELIKRYEKMAQWAKAQEEARARGEKYENPEPKTRPGDDDAANTVRGQDKEGRFQTDDRGFVRSNKKGPVRFADQKQAAKWILNVGQKQSPDQVFEIANHPSGKGFTVRETGRTKPEEPRAKPGEQTDTSSSAGAARQSPPGEPSPNPADEGTKLIGAPRAETQEPNTKQPAEDIRSQGSERGKEEPRADRGEDGGAAEQPAPGRAQDSGATDPGEGGARARDPGEREPAQAGRGDGAEEVAGQPGARAAAADAGEAQGPAQAGARAEASGEAKPDADVGGVDRAVEASVKLYSTPFDPDLFKKALSGLTAWTKDQIDQVVADLQRMFSLRKKDQSRLSSNLVADFARLTLATNDGMLRSLARRFGARSAEAKNVINEIADLFFAAPGVGGKSVGKTFSEAVERVIGRSSNKVLGLLDSLKDLPHTQRSQIQEQIGRLLASGNIDPSKGRAHKIAAEIRDLLKEWRDYAAAAGIDIGNVKNYFPRQHDVANIIANREAFIQDATKAYRSEGMTPTEARAAAEAYFQRIREGDLGFRSDGNDFVQIPRGTSTRPEKGRVLGPKADQILDRWYIRDPAEALPAYFTQMARRVEWARRMGPKNEKWQAYRQRLIDSGAGEAIPEIVKTIESITGSMPSNLSAGARQAVGLVRTWGILATLSRATLSSILEPIIIAARSGNAGDALKSYMYVLRDITKLGDAKLARGLAEDLGVVMQASADSIMMQRFGGEMDGKFTRWLTDRFFKYNGLYHFTEASRVAAVSIGQTFLRRLALSIDGDGALQKSSRLMVKELGVPENEIDGFTKWVKSQNDGRPTREALRNKGKYEEMYKDALSRFAEQSILKPRSVEKPRWANHPVGGLAYALMSYNYSFTKNVLQRFGSLARNAAFGKDLNMADRARLLMPLGIYGLVVAGQYQLGEWRDEIFKDPAKDPSKPEMAEEAKWIRAVSRAGGFGYADTLVNMVTSLKYGKDPSTVMTGPFIGMISELLSQGINTLDPMSKVGGADPTNNPNTNTQERKFARTVYDYIVRPAAVGASTAIPGGALTAPLRVAGIQAPAMPSIREDLFVEPLAGPPEWEKRRYKRKRVRQERERR